MLSEQFWVTYCWVNAETLLSHCWIITESMLSQCWTNTESSLRHQLVKTESTPSQRWVNSQSMLSQCLVKALSQRWVNIQRWVNAESTQSTLRSMLSNRHVKTESILSQPNTEHDTLIEKNYNKKLKFSNLTIINMIVVFYLLILLFSVANVSHISD